MGPDCGPAVGETATGRSPRRRGNILATNAGDETFRVALDALKIRANTGRNTVGHAVVGVPIPLSRR